MESMSHFLAKSLRCYVTLSKHLLHGNITQMWVVPNWAQRNTGIPKSFVCFLCVSPSASLSFDLHCAHNFFFKFPVLKQICIKLTSPLLSYPGSPLCASTGLHYHVGNIRFDNAELRVEVHHRQGPPLSGNTTRRCCCVNAIDFQLAEDSGME